jgi:hypothetical protein
MQARVYRLKATIILSRTNKQGNSVLLQLGKVKCMNAVFKTVVFWEAFTALAS